MSQAWGLCPKCGKTIPLDPVDFPGGPPELVRHLAECPVQLGTSKEAGPSGSEGASSLPAPATLEAFQSHGSPRVVSTRPHARPRRASP